MIYLLIAFELAILTFLYYSKWDWRRLFAPNAWIQLQPTSLIWDKRLNELMDTRPVKLSYCVAHFGDVQVWVANYPYAYGTKRGSSEELPLLKTRRRLKRIVERAAYND